MKKDFVFLDKIIKGIRWDAKYATWDNFTGKPVAGYEVNRIAGTYDLAIALSKVQKQAAALGYGLLLWDGYRPKRAVASFLQWANGCEDTMTKAKYHPHIQRRELITQGYIASKSSHSRGSAIDLTLYHLADGEKVPMGSDFDFMDKRSHQNAQDISPLERENRDILKTIMATNAFIPYACEWWHYVLKDEPYPTQYFDFPLTEIDS